MRCYLPSRRSTYLILFGALLIVYGLAIVKVLEQAQSLPLYATVPVDVQGWGWVGCGSIAVLSTVVPGVPRWLGFAAAILPLLLWCAGFAWLWIVVGDSPVAWNGTMLWGVLAALAMVSAGDEDVRGGHG